MRRVRARSDVLSGECEAIFEKYTWASREISEKAPKEISLSSRRNLHLPQAAALRQRRWLGEAA
eukprot:4319955-Prymnesium_polylepis.1